MKNNRLRNFLSGRYGIDNLFFFLTVCYFILTVTTFILGFFITGSTVGLIIYYLLEACSLVFIIYILCRVLSRDLSKRAAENVKFMNIWRKIFKKDPKFSRSAYGSELPPDTASVIFRRCKWCGVALRLPNQRGKHQVRCPKCGRIFDIKV